MATFLKDDKGNDSATRLIFVIGSFWNMSMTTYLMVTKAAGAGELIAFFTAIQAVLIGLKLGQKPMENKTE